MNSKILLLKWIIKSIISIAAFHAPNRTLLISDRHSSPICEDQLHITMRLVHRCAAIPPRKDISEIFDSQLLIAILQTKDDMTGIIQITIITKLGIEVIRSDSFQKLNRMQTIAINYSILTIATTKYIGVISFPSFKHIIACFTVKDVFTFVTS